MVPATVLDFTFAIRRHVWRRAQLLFAAARGPEDETSQIPSFALSVNS
jgi:hypothetical protein